MTYSEPRMPAWQRALSDRVAVDIVLAWLVAAATYVAVAIDAPPVLRVLLAGTALLVLPGYVVVAVLFPHRGAVAAPGRLSTFRGPDGVSSRERLALAFGLSLAMLPVIGILVSISPWGFSESTVAGAFAAFVGVGGLFAAVVRRRLPPAKRFRIPIDRWTTDLRGALGRGSATERAVNALVIASVVVALLAAGGALAVPQGGESFTDFAVLAENDDGELVAGGYPDDLAANGSATLVTAVENREGEPTTYTVVVTMERMDASADGSNASGGAAPGANASDGATVELQRFEATVEPGQRWTRRHEVEPALAGERVRVHYYLYRGDAPATPDASSAYRHLWLSVSNGAA